MNTQDRRRTLARYLNGFRVDQTEHLHGGRVPVSPLDDYIDKIEALYAAALHDDSTVDQAQTRETKKGGA